VLAAAKRGSGTEDEMSATFRAIDHRSRFVPFKAPAGAMSSSVHSDAFEPLARQAVSISADRNEEIFEEGAPAKYCYFVVSGCVRTVKLMEDGRSPVGEFLLPGDLLGWGSLDEYDFSAEAVTPVKLRRYSRSMLEDFADRDRNFARRLRALTAGQLRTARERMVLLGRKTASERIATFLLEMAERVHADMAGLIELPMSRTDMADHLGLTIETVCRGLTELRRHGTIAIERTRIAIRDRRALGSAGCMVLN
jgi:CRP/FNR family transcriptional regulator, nitrogen fixation regulation protein